MKKTVDILPWAICLTDTLMGRLTIRISPAIFLCLSLLISEAAQARVVEEVNVRETDTGYVMTFHFFSPMRFVSLVPQGLSRAFEIQINPELQNPGDGADGIEERNVLSWNKDLWTPIKDIVYDGSGGDYPQIIIRFSDNVKLKVRSSADLRSMTVSVDASQLKRTSRIAPESSGDLLSALQTDDPKLAQLIEEARAAMLEKNYSRAVQLFTKIHDGSTAEIRRRAREMIGIARENNAQLAHAKREYEIFIEEYPEGSDTDRVRQRLAALLTAAATARPGTATQKEGGWQTEFYGSFAQRYYRDETTPEDEDSIVLRDQLMNDLDFIGKARKGGLDLKTQFIGSYREDFDVDNEDEFLPNIASIEARLADAGLYARVGRQSRTSGGVLGRFDGVHGAYDIGEDITLNAVFGYPVLIDEKDTLNSAQEFFGTSVDIRDLPGGWDMTGFYINQDNEGAKDREAVGTELRYIDDRKSYFTLVDYDIYFDDLNIFLFLGNWNYSDETRFTLNLDYRNSPVLTKTNAIQGQNVMDLKDLFDIFSDAELKQLAQDRTAINRTVTGTVTHELNKKWQIIGELTATEFDDMPASGGVEAIPGTDMEYYFATQLIANQFLYDNDIAIFGVRYGDTTNADVYTFTTNWRVNINRKFRINPRFRIDYRENKDDNGSRTIIKPFIRIDYNIKKWVKFEMDLGYEWYDEKQDFGSYKNNSYYFSAGYRVQF